MNRFTDAWAQECPGRRGEDDVTIGQAYQQRQRLVSSVYSWAGKNAPLSARERLARKPGPVTIIKG